MCTCTFSKQTIDHPWKPPIPHTHPHHLGYILSPFPPPHTSMERVGPYIPCLLVAVEYFALCFAQNTESKPNVFDEHCYAHLVLQRRMNGCSPSMVWGFAREGGGVCTIYVSCLISK